MATYTKVVDYKLSVPGKVRRLVPDSLESYSQGMQNNLHNWTYENVTGFLKEKGFDFFDDVPNIGKAWISYRANGEPKHMVEVKPTDRFYSSKTLKRMIRQSGIAEEEWLKRMRS